MTAFVTVGTTSFDDLIKVVNTIKFHIALFSLGYKKLFIQYGSGNIVPSVSDSPLEVIAFRYRTNLSSIFSQSDLVISHGGAGTCMEALSPPGKRKLIIVINENLMNNHQEELASTLFEERHAFVSRAKELYHFISSGDQSPFLNCLVRFTLFLSSSGQLYIMRPDRLDFIFNLQKTKFWCDCDPKTLFSPSTTPESVGLVPFQRGNVSLLIDFLNSKMFMPAR